MYIIDRNLLPSTLPDVEVKPYTLQHFAAWLETMPPDAEYDFYGIRSSCILQLYAKSVGEHISDFAALVARFGESISDTGGIADIAADGDDTFGDALSRTRAAMGAAQ